MTREEYKNSNLVFTNKAIVLGRRHLMNQWEKPFIEKYMLDLLKKYQPTSVLEVGFGYGYTALVINAYPTVTRHVIIEPHPQILALAYEWAKDKKVEIIPKFVEDYSTLEEFDLVWDDIYDITGGRMPHGVWLDSQARKKNYEYFTVAKLIPYMTEAEKAKVAILINEEINA